MFLKILVFVIVLVLILRFLSRFFLSMFLTNLSNRVSQAQHSNYQEKGRRKDGEVIVNSNSRKSDKKYKINEGEYVDFEEIKE